MLRRKGEVVLVRQVAEGDAHLRPDANVLIAAEHGLGLRLRDGAAEVGVVDDSGRAGPQQLEPGENRPEIDLPLRPLPAPDGRVIAASPHLER